LNEEISNFCSLYFEQHVETKANNLPLGISEELDSEIPEFFQHFEEGSTSNIKENTRWLSSREYELAHLYVLSNIEKLREYEE